MKHLFVPREIYLKGIESGLMPVIIVDHNGSTRDGILYQQLVDWFREKEIVIEVSEWDRLFNGKIKPLGKSLKWQSLCKTTNYYMALNEALTEAFKLINP